MLYEQWRQTARARGEELALMDLSSGTRWSFAELDRQSESGGPLARQGVVHPQGCSAEFVLAVLRAWRSGSVVCPLEPGQAPPRVPAPKAPCLHLKTTSATTGEGRLIAFTGPQLAADAAQIVTTMGLRPDWPTLGAISMAHSYGFSNLVLPLLLHGIPLILAPSPLPESIRRAADLAWPLTLPGVPVLWKAWHEAGVIPPNVRLAISAGAPLPASLESAVFGASGLKIHNFYGSSECGGIAYDSTNVPRSDESCVGTAMHKVVLETNPDGCLLVRSDAVADGYWPNPDATLQNGCFRTSDVVELKDGLVFLRGRLSDQVNVAGRKVSPASIEAVLSEHPAVGHCLVFGVPSGEGGRSESIVACVVARSAVTAEDLRRFLLKRLRSWQVPRDWWFLDALEANQRGKLSRAEWRRRYLDQRGG